MRYQNTAYEASPNDQRRVSVDVFSGEEEDVFNRKKKTQGHSGKENSQEDPRERRWRLLKQAAMVFLSTLGLWAVGSVVAFTSVIAYDLETHNTTIYGEHIALSSELLDEMSSLKTIASIPSICFISSMMTLFGRRPSMAICGLLTVLGWLGIVFIPGLNGMVASRVISGVGTGGLIISINTYIIELVDRDVRGMMSIIGNVGFLGGQVVTLALGYAFRYYTVGLLLMILPFVFLLSLPWLPRGPSVLLLEGREDDARKALVRLRGKYADIDAEIQIYKDMNQVTKKNRSPWKELLTRKTLIALAKVCILFALVQFTGTYVISSNSSRIFREAGSSIDGDLASIIVTSVQLVVGACASLIIDKLGRRRSLIMSYGIMSIPLAVLTAYFAIFSGEIQKMTNPYSWIPVVCLMISQAAVALGANPIPFILSNEYFPTFIRPQASGICLIVGTLMGFIFLEFYSQMVDGMSRVGLFAFYTCSCVVSIPFTYFFIKETKGKHIG